MAACQRVVVVVAVELVEPVTPPVPVVVPLVEPEAPIELAPPEDDVSLLVDPGVVVPLLPLVVPPVELPAVPPVAPLVLGDVPLLGDGVVVDELEDEVVGAGVVSSRLVQAPSETAATSASAAHEVRDAFIGNSLRGLFEK